MKLVALLHSFQKSDWHWFGKFVKSPIFNKNRTIIQLYDFFQQEKNRNKTALKSENLSEVLFPGLPFQAAKTHHAANYFLKAVEDYFSWEEWQNDRSEQMLSLLKACHRRGLDRHFHSVLLRLREWRAQQPLRNPEHYRFEYRIALEEYQHSMQAGRSGAEQLQPLSDWHDTAFIAEKLKIACILISRQKLLKTEFDTGLLPLVLTFLQMRPALLEHPAVAVYYYGYRALTEPHIEAHFFSLKARLSDTARQFPAQELRDVYLLAVNFCIHRINERQNAYLPELLHLYQEGLRAGVFLENGQLSRFTYTNIALLALRMREYEWVYSFIERYRDTLPEAQRQGAYSFILARYYCETGDFDQSITLLQSMDFDDVLHNLMAKTMLIRMYYATGAYNALGSLLDSFETYLRRKRQIGDQQRSAYRNTVRFVRKLLALPPGHTRARQALQKEIAATTLLAEKEWLLSV